MEREDHKDRLEVAVRLYNELCAQYPNRFITLFDETACVFQPSISLTRQRSRHKCDHVIASRA
jgi:hypothetical protein